MLSEYVLPFSEQPLIACYHNMAFPMGIIEGNASVFNKDITPWAIAKFLNVIFIDAPNSNSYDICLFDKWGTNDGILFHQYINMFKSIYGKLQINIIKYLSELIKSGCYITGAYNERYIPGKMVYQQADFLHDYILYGVNENRKIFYSAGYLKDKRYRSYEISFSDFINSIYNTSNDRIQFGFWTYNKEYEYEFNRERIRGELDEYIKSTTSHNFRKDVFYGVEANRKLKEFFLYCINNYDTPIIDLRYSRAYMEHKNIFFRCIKYLFEAQHVSFKQSDILMANEMYQNAIMIHRLGIKMNISKNYKIIEQITDLFEKNQEYECEIIMDVLGAL